MEMIMVVAIMAIMLAAGLPATFDFYLNYQFDSEYDTAVSAFRLARNLAMVNYNESDHGVYLADEEFIVFQGTTYATRDTSKDRSYPRASVITITGSSELVFTALSGQTASTTYAVSDGRKSRDIFINSEGLVYEPNY